MKLKKLLIASIFLLFSLFTLSNGYSATITAAATGNWNASATWTGGVVPVAGDSVVISGNFIVTIPVGETYTCKAITINGVAATPNGTSGLVIDGTLSTTGGIKLTGGSAADRIADIKLNSTGTLNIGGTIFLYTGTGNTTFTSSGTLNVTGNIDIGTGAGTGDAFLYPNGGTINITGNLNISGPTGYGFITFKAPTTVNFIGATSIFDIKAYGEIDFSTFSSIVNLTNSGSKISIAGGANGKLNMGTGSSVINVSGTFTNAGTFTCGNSTINYLGTGSQTIAAVNYFNLTSLNDGPRTIAGTIGIAGTFTKGNSIYTVTGSTVNYNGTGAQTITALNYNNLTISGARTTNSVTLDNQGIIGIAGTLANSSTYTAPGAIIATESTINYNGAASQSVISFPYHHLLITKPVGIAASTVNNSSIKVNGNCTIVSGTLSIGTGLPVVGQLAEYTFEGIPASSILEVKDGAKLTLLGTSAFPASFPNKFINVILNPTSELDYASIGAQSIVAYQYGNLTCSGGGSRTLAATGSIQVAGSFASGNPSYTTTGSLIEFNGTGAQLISGNIGSTASPFEKLTINNTGSGNAAVSLGAAATVIKEIKLNEGILKLNGQVFTIDSTATLIRVNGSIVCETTDNTGKIQRNIGNNIGTYIFPFAKDKDNYIPFTFQLTTGDAANISVSTYGTGNDNTPLPSSAPAVDSLEKQGPNADKKDIKDAAGTVVNRFWQIESSVPTGTRTATLIFTATETETGIIDEFKARRWSNTAWDAALPSQTYTRTTVTVPGVTAFSPWTIYGKKMIVPLADFSADKTTACVGEPIQFTDKSLPAATTWNWTFAGGNPATSTDPNPIVTYSTAGTYTVTLQADNSNGAGIPKTKTGYITINAIPTSTFTVSKDDICFGESAKVTYTGSAGPIANFSWNFGTDASPATATTSGLPGGHGVSWASSGAKTISLSVTENGCLSVLTTKAVSANPELVLTTSATSVSGCTNNDGTATASVTGGTPPYTYLWNDANAQTTSTATGLIPGNYSVTITDAASCTKTSSVVVGSTGIALAKPTMSGKANTCFGKSEGSAKAEPTDGAAPYTYSWTGPNGFTATTQEITGLAKGTYSVIVTDSKGCSSPSNSFEVQESTLVIANAGIDTLICKGDSIVLTAVTTGGTSPYTYLWKNGATTAQTKVGPIVNTAVDILVTDANSCKATDTVMVNVKTCEKTPVTDFDYVIDQNTRTVTFTDKSTNVPTGWIWTFGDTESSVLQNPVHTFAVDGLFNVCLGATNGAGTNEKCKDINVKKTVGINTLTADQFVIYPNPTANDLYIKGDLNLLETIIITDVMGRTMQSFNKQEFISGKLDIHSLSNGFYLVRIISSDSSLVTKIEVNK